HFSIRPRLARLGIRTLTVLRFLPPGGAIRAFEFQGDPGLVQLDPSGLQAARQFLTLGFVHILDGPDHLLFLLCLVIPFRRFRSLVAVVTAFTVAHAITMIASAYDLAPGVLWFPPLVETLIAAAIVYLALENIVFTAVSSGRVLKRRWLIAFGFGLVHGFGFSFGLRQTLQYAGSHVLTSLLSFNVGIELGQVLVLALLIPALDLLFRFLVPERTGTVVLSALVAHTAWHCLGDRWDLLRRFTFEWPAIDAAFLAGTLRWMMLLVVCAGLYWLVFGIRSLKSEV
ncbi:MAG TPA: HupE/UreJ family protein, partial [Vicinamibacterales bacterium]|nr:HupE/UreJ family protein [Vicinamibacterales bacterium]